MHTLCSVRILSGENLSQENRRLFTCVHRCKAKLAATKRNNPLLKLSQSSSNLAHDPGQAAAIACCELKSITAVHQHCMDK